MADNAIVINNLTRDFGAVRAADGRPLTIRLWHITPGSSSSQNPPDTVYSPGMDGPVWGFWGIMFFNCVH